MTRRLRLGLMCALLLPADAAAQGIFTAPTRPGEPVLAARVPMVRDLRTLGRGRALEPRSIERLARRGPAFPTLERMLDRVVRERDDRRRAAYAYELLRVVEPHYERSLVAAFGRAGEHSAAILSRALAHLGGDAPIDALVSGLGRSPTAASAEDALASMGSEAREALLEAAGDGARAPGVFRALGRLRARQAKRLLFSRAMEPDPVVSRAAGAALVFLDPEGERARAEALVRELAGEERTRFLRALFRIDASAAIALLEPHDLADGALALALAASSAPASAKASHLSGAPEAARVLVGAALATTRPGRAILAAAAPDEGLVPALTLARVRAESPEERGALDAALVRSGADARPLELVAPEAAALPTPRLFRALHDPRTFAAAALALAGPMRGAGRTARRRYAAVVRAGLRDDDARIRLGACAALSEFYDPGAVSALARALEDPAASVRFMAAVALEAIGGARARAALDVAVAVEMDLATREALEAARAGRPERSELGRVLLGGAPTAIPNVVILFASGAGIAY